MPFAEGDQHARRALSFFQRKGEEERPQPAPGLAPGKVVGDFRLLSLIGQGGMGQVWEAEQVSLHRNVAVKFVRPERVTERQLELFAREARAGGRLHHAGIVNVHAHGQSDGLAWIAMEFIDGAWTLRDFMDEIARTGEVPEGYDRHVARFVAEIADAMQAAHEAGVIHRDLKPQNVLIAPDDRAKVTDFGLARITDESAMSQTGDIAGTCLYMSPEQLKAKRTGLDHRTDVFSLGIVLYELLALRRPFEGDTMQQLAEQILHREPPDPRTFRSKVPRDLAVIATHALEKDRDKRYPTMKELAADLRRHLADEPIHATPPTRLDRTVKWVKRNPTKSTAAAIAAVAFSAITGLLVQNLRANRALSAERTNLTNANAALRTKTAEAEASAAEALDNARIAKTNEQRADREAEAATRGRDEVLRLSALQKLDDLVAEADRLWPAHPEILPKYEEWLRKAGELVAELPDHEKKLAELRSRSVAWTEDEQASHRAEHPNLVELETAKRHIEHFRHVRAALESDEPPWDPSPEAVGIDVATLPATARALNDLAWPLIDPDRKNWGGEGKGLVLARRAVEVAAELAPYERANIRDSLAWALFANGRFDEAMAAEEKALEEAAPDKKKEFEDYVEKLKKRIEEEIDPGKEAERDKHVAELEARISELETEVSERPEWQFADAQDTWWHNQLEKLVRGLQAFSDSQAGLAPDGISALRGWSVPKRAEFAGSIAARSVSGSEATARWAEAIASVSDASSCPAYGGLRITPQMGLLPIGRDPYSNLWEFSHLQTGEPALRGPDGKLVLMEETGIVFVLLPSGTFTIGAQSTAPNGPNHDPKAEPGEAPPHAVTLSPFFLSKYEMTQGQWERFTGGNPSYYDRGRYSPGGNRAHKAWSALHPVEQVSWTTCEETLSRLGLSLPSEAQWEYGARAGTETPWWPGTDETLLAEAGNVSDAYAKANGGPFGTWEAWDDGNTYHARVGEYRPNPFGLHDVHGNVWEWCQDGFGPYQAGAAKDPLSRAGGSSSRVFRGGGFSYSASQARSAFRYGLSPSVAGLYLGARPARGISP